MDLSYEEIEGRHCIVMKVVSDGETMVEVLEEIIAYAEELSSYDERVDLLSGMHLLRSGKRTQFIAWFFLDLTDAVMFRLRWS